MNSNVTDPLEELSRWTVLYLATIVTVPFTAAWIWIATDGHWGVFAILVVAISLAVYTTSRMLNREPVADTDA